MATALSRFQPFSCCTTITWQPSASGVGLPAGCLMSSTKLFPGTKLGAIGRVGILKPRNAVFRLQVMNKEARHNFAPAMRCTAQVGAHDKTGQLTKCAPEEGQREVMGSNPVANLFGPAFLSGRVERGDNAAALFLESYQEPLIEAPPAGAALPLDASCHMSDYGKIVEDQILQNRIGALLEEQAMLEASFQAHHSGPLLLPESLDVRLSSRSPVATDAKPPPESTFQKLQNMLMGTARLLGAMVLAAALAFCTPHPALAARSMGRAGGGGFSSSRSSGGSSRSSSSSSSRSSSSSSGRSSPSSSSRLSSSRSSRSSSSSGGSSGFGFHWGSTPTSPSSTQTDHSGQSGGHTGGHSPIHPDSHGKSGVKASGGGAAGNSAGKPPKPESSPSSSGQPRWFRSGSHEPEEPHLSSHSHSNASASIHVHLDGPTRLYSSSHPGAYHYSNTKDRLLRSFLRGLSGDYRSRDTWQQQEAATEAPGPEEAAADAEARVRNAHLREVIIVVGIFVLLAWLAGLETKGESDPWARSNHEKPGSASERDESVNADASRAAERTRADVSKGHAPEGTRVYDFDPDVENVLTIVKVQVALLGQAKSVQVQMDKLCEEADTSSKEGLHKLLTETLLVILRHYTYWAYANAQMDAMKYPAAEGRYQQIALEERSKAEQETLVNKGGKLVKTPSIRNPDDEPTPTEFIVVTILAAVKGRLEARDGENRVATRESLTGALQALSQVQADDLEVLDILWAPQEEDDTLTHAELIENFTDLSPM